MKKVFSNAKAQELKAIFNRLSDVENHNRSFILNVDDLIVGKKYVFYAEDKAINSKRGLPTITSRGIKVLHLGNGEYDYIKIKSVANNYVLYTVCDSSTGRLVEYDDGYVIHTKMLNASNAFLTDAEKEKGFKYMVFEDGTPTFTTPIYGFMDYAVYKAIRRHYLDVVEKYERLDKNTKKAVKSK